MRLFLVRHAECEHNVGYATVKPGHLTELGREQALRLAQHFRDQSVRFTRVFSSDLERATETARAICRHQLGSGPALEPFRTAKLREQCSGCGPVFGETIHVESTSSMRARVNGFIRDHILPEMASYSKGRDVNLAIVGHRVILPVLWACLTEMFGSQSFHLSRSAASRGNHYTHPSWSNTGVMEVDIRPGDPPQDMLVKNTIYPNVEPPWLRRSGRRQSRGGSDVWMGWSVTVLTVDDTAHLDRRLLGTTVPPVLFETKSTKKRRIDAVG
ncbi:Uncharacterized protein PECH_000121 [Penicillium ucsense]|uniref:Phosphoglycerate mutase n=1 Tax=Penicillium ucsense TaxID=2839758 RepID=A0A8J8W3L4_9EURO|nr:Uncharacterized protein PECM_005760 [Penicillium ucsense]KAF7739602.1 Uncharacterized protein PECH_000121 [Penicillium ucsense]